MYFFSDLHPQTTYGTLQNYLNPDPQYCQKKQILARLYPLYIT